MSKLLTVVTVTYNKGDRNRSSIQSILDQSFQDFEYIVVNDASPDNTKKILEEFDDPRLKIIHQENKGFVKTMISVMNQINTPYVAIQGAGDISLPERLEQQLKYLESRPDVGVVSATTYQAFEAKISIPKSSETFNRSEKPEKFEYTTIDQMIKTNIIDHGEAMIRMSAYREAGGYRAFFRYVQDRDLWLRILEKYSIVKLKQPLYVKVTNPKFDISGNPQKSEEQALYSLFARYLAQERVATGKDPLDERGESTFKHFIEALSESSKEEILSRVFRNTIKSKNSTSRESIEKAIAIIQKYSPKHQLIRSLKIFLFMIDKIPYGGEIYYRYIHNVKNNIERAKVKLSKLIGGCCHQDGRLA